MNRYDILLGKKPIVKRTYSRSDFRKSVSETLTEAVINDMIKKYGLTSIEPGIDSLFLMPAMKKIDIEIKENEVGIMPPIEMGISISPMCHIEHTIA